MTNEQNEQEQEPISFGEPFRNEYIRLNTEERQSRVKTLLLQMFSGVLFNLAIYNQKEDSLDLIQNLELRSVDLGENRSIILKTNLGEWELATKYEYPYLIFNRSRVNIKMRDHNHDHVRWMLEVDTTMDEFK